MATVLLWLWLGILGFLLSRLCLRSDDPWLALGSAFPLALLTLLGFSLPLAGLFGHPRGWVLAAIVLFVASVALYVKRESLGAPELLPFGLSTWQWAAFMTVLTVSNLPMRVEEGLRGHSGFWLDFPQLSLMARGEFPPPEPFDHQGSLFLDLGRDYLLGLLSWFAGGGASVLTSGWALDHALLLSGFFLVFGLGHRRWGVSGGFLSVGFLYLGWSVEGSVGLMETYGGSGLLVHLTLLLLVGLACTEQLQPAGEAGLMFGLGVFGIMCAPALLALLLALGGVAILQSVADSGAEGTPLRRALGRGLGAVGIWGLLWGAAFGGLAGTGLLTGVLSGQAALMALQWSPEQLLWPGLASGLGLLAGAWLTYRRRPEGAVLWLYGLLAWAAPGLLNFGPFQEVRRLFFYQSASLVFALCLALFLAELWVRTPRLGVRVGIALLAVAACLGGERRIHRAFGEIASASPEQRERVASPFYPAPTEWLLGIPALGLDGDLLSAAQVLHRLSSPQDRLLTDVELTPWPPASEGGATAEGSLLLESALLGVTGLRSVGSRPSEQGGPVAPQRLRTGGWQTFWATGEVRLLPAFGARWLLAHRPESRAVLEPLVESGALRLEFEQGSCAVYRFNGRPRPYGAVAKEPVLSFLLTSVEYSLPGDEPFLWVELRIDGPFEALQDGVQEIDLRWLALEPGLGQSQGEPVRYLSDALWDGGQGESRHLRLPLPLPGAQGDYRLEVRLNGRVVEPTPERQSVGTYTVGSAGPEEAVSGAAGDSKPTLPPGGEVAPQQSENGALR